MGVSDGQPINASVTNAAFLNKNQADQMTFPVSLTKTLSFSKRDESSAATINDLDSSQSLVNITATVTTINGAVAPATYTDGAILVIANSSANSITINHDSGSATASNRFSLPGSTALTILAGQAAQFYYNLTDSRWKQMSGTGSGSGSAGINYILNPDAIVDTIGWATYADAAGSQPVDGTGGSPNITWTRSTTTPLRGTGDFNLVKDAANRQGQGVSYDITIDNADLARVLTVSFDYELLSGTYVTGDLTVYLIQDPTGTPVVIQPAGYQVVAATAGTKMTQIATFQTDSSQRNYRLCFHVATTSALDYTLALDNIVVGPTQKVYGAPVTDCKKYIPTIANGGTTTSNAGDYRQVGDSMAINIITIYSGAGSAAALTYQLPSGFSIDTSKLPSSAADQSIVGICQWYDASVGQERTGSVVYRSSTTVALVIDNNGSTVLQGNALANLDWIRLNFTVPILGLSSNVEVSSSTDTRVVAARYARSASSAANALVANSYTRVNFDIVASGGYDTFAAVTTGASWVFTAPIPGQYKISGLVSLATAGANGDRLLRITGASSGIYRSVVNVPTFGVQICFPISTEVSLSAGQTIFAEVLIPASATDTIISETDRTHITIERLSGPSQIAASESVIEIRENRAGSTINTTATTIPYATQIKSSHGGWNTTNHEWTAPISGTYSIFMLYQLIAAIVARPSELSFLKNGSAFVSISNKTSTAATTDGSYGDRNELTGSTLVDLIAGDKLSFQSMSPNGAQSLNSVAGYNRISIFRVGN